MNLSMACSLLHSLLFYPNSEFLAKALIMASVSCRLASRSSDQGGRLSLLFNKILNKQVSFCLTSMIVSVWAMTIRCQSSWQWLRLMRKGPVICFMHSRICWVQLWAVSYGLQAILYCLSIFWMLTWFQILGILTSEAGCPNTSTDLRKPKRQDLLERGVIPS